MIHFILNKINFDNLTDQGFKRTNVVSESYSTVSESKAVLTLPMRSPIKKGKPKI